MTAKEVLRDLRGMTRAIQRMQVDIAVLRQEADGLRSMELTDMPKGGKKRDVADAIAELVDVQLERDELFYKRVKKHEKTLVAISKVEDNDQRAVLNYRYVLGRDWDDIARELGYSIRSIYRIHGTALQSFVKYFDAE